MSVVTKEWLTELHRDSLEIRLPLATFSPELGMSNGAAAVIAGMHPGEAAGLLAAQDLLATLSEAELHGTVKILPIVSVEAFYARALQLSPIDERECHYMSPGNCNGSYTEHLVDMVFRAVRDVDVVIDLHGGELVQDLTPYVCSPWRGQEDALWTACREISECFDVEFVAKRDLCDAGVILPTALLDEGIPNVWTEIGRNGVPESSAIRLQQEGVCRVLGRFGIIEGVETLARRPRVVGPQHWVVFAKQSGVWRADVAAGQRVVRGQTLGVITDEFGSPLQRYEAPGSGVVELVCTSPAINHGRTPHDNHWHQLLVQIASDEDVGL